MRELNYVLTANNTKAVCFLNMYTYISTSRTIQGNV